VALIEISAGTGIEASEGDDGDIAVYKEMLAFFDGNNFEDAQMYAKAQEYIDTDSFIDYCIAEIFFGNIDWPANNVKLWRFKTDYNPGAPYGQDGRWRWLLADLDSTSGAGYFSHSYSFDSLSRVFNPAQWNDAYIDSESTKIIRRLIMNDAFKDEFINRFCDVMNTYYTADAFVAMIDRYAAEIEPAVYEQLMRWQRSYSGAKAAGDVNGMAAQWKAEVAGFKKFAQNRPDYMMRFIQKYFGLGDIVTLTAQTDRSKGNIAVNGISIDEYAPGTDGVSIWQGKYFERTGHIIEAIPSDGYKFEKFTVTTSGQSEDYYTNPLPITLIENAAVEAVFTEAPGAEDGR
jgi:hypothetical protein